MKTVLGIQLDKELSEVLGGSRGFISVLKNRGSIPYDECVIFALDRNISLDWLILGRGTKEAGGAAPAPIPAHMVEVPLLDAMDWPKAFEEQSWYVPRQWLDQERLEAGDVIAVRVVGDAMADTLPEGHVVLVNCAQQSADGLYLVRFDDTHAYFRRIQHMVDGSLRMSCDSPGYVAEVVPAADRDRLQIIGYCHSVVRAVR